MNLDSNFEFDVKRFFRWWSKELAFLVPIKLRQWLSDQSGQIYVAMSANFLRMTRIVEEEEQELAMLPIDKRLPAVYAQLKIQYPELEHARCILRLNAKQAIAKILYMPAAVKENLHQVIEFELDRYLPFKAEEVYFAVKLLGKADNGQIRVLLVASPKEKVDALIADLNTFEIHPDVAEFVKAANDFDDDPEPYNLLPDHLRPATDQMAKIMTWSIAFAAFVLTVAALVFPVWHEGKVVDSLKRQIAALEKDTHIVQARQLEIDDMINETEQLLKTKNNMPPLTELIDTLSQLIPDDTWLNHLQYNNDRLQLQGQSPAASLLIGILEASPLFSNARFVSPLTQDRQTGMERFQISVEVQPEEDHADA